MQLIDVGACSVVHTQQAHSGAVWSLALLPDKSGFVTGSAGGQVVRGFFWFSWLFWGFVCEFLKTSANCCPSRCDAVLAAACWQAAEHILVEGWPVVH